MALLIATTFPHISRELSSGLLCAALDAVLHRCRCYSGFKFRALLHFVVALSSSMFSTFLFLESSLTDRMLKTNTIISIKTKLT